jgi:CubicO group peptidase (beta-lactamase class C family)
MRLPLAILFFTVFFILSCNNTKIESDFLNPFELNQIENLIEKAIDKNSIPGAVVLVAKNNQIIYKKAFGIKNPETNDTYQIDDIFRIASMTKAITSIGIMKLWERGLIGLDDPIENYIPEFKNVGILDKFFPKDSTFTIKPTKKKITIRNLLTHTSGLGYGFIDGNPEIKATYVKEKNKFMPEGVLGFSDSDVTIEETIKRMAKMPLHHEPGERFTYAIGIDVLGYLIEIISGETLSEFLEKEIFRPLEMNDTYFYLPEEKRNKLVPILTKKEDQWNSF